MIDTQQSQALQNGTRCDFPISAVWCAEDQSMQERKGGAGMKKRRLAAILCGVCLALLAAGCAPDRTSPPGPKTVEGKIVFLSGTTICVAEDGEHAREDGLYSVSTEGAEIWGHTEHGILKPGMRAAVRNGEAGAGLAVWCGISTRSDSVHPVRLGGTGLYRFRKQYFLQRTADYL